MATMPAFDDACELARKTGVIDRLGVHLALNEGCPLTDGIKKFPRFCNPDGLFNPEISSGAFRLKKDELCAVVSEIRAQIKRVKDAGIIPTHFDSHLHLHLKNGLIKIFAKTAFTEGIRYVRKMRNVCMVQESLKQKIKIYSANFLLRSFGMSCADYYTHLEEAAALIKSGRKFPPGSSMEVNFHPYFDPAEGLVNLSFGNKDRGFVEQIKIVVFGNQVMSYGDLFGG